MNKILKIIIPIIVILLCVVIFIIFNNDNEKVEENTINSAGEAEEYVKKLNQALIEGGTKEELMTLFGNKNFFDEDIMTGKDSFLRTTPESEIIKNYSLDNYVNVASELADNLENKIKDNFEYNIESISESNGQYDLVITYKSYYYLQYFNDLTSLQMALIDRAGINLEEETDENKIVATAYMAKIKAASIIDKYLDTYVNNDEINTVTLSFAKGKIENSSDSLESYLMNILGYAYQNELANSLNERVSQYLAEAGNNPFEI